MNERSSDIKNLLKSLRGVGGIYFGWALISISVSFSAGGSSASNLTRLLVLALLMAEVLLFSIIRRASQRLSPRFRFVSTGVILASIVELFHMISKPVFDSVTIVTGDTLKEAATKYLIDLVFTVPAYIIILNVMWGYIVRYNYTTWGYILIMGLAQVLGDGGIYFFAGAPGLLLLLPYPASNYHAMNIVPYLLVRDDLPSDRKQNFIRASSAVFTIIVVYQVCGALVGFAGKFAGYR